MAGVYNKKGWKTDCAKKAANKPNLWRELIWENILEQTDFAEKQMWF